MPDSRISAVFRVWHNPCNPCDIPGKGLGRETKGNFKMTVTVNNALAAFAAFTLSVLCMAAAIVPASPAGLLV